MKKVPILICTVGSPSLEITLSSIRLYAKEAPIYLSSRTETMDERVFKWVLNSSGNFGDAYNKIMDDAFQHHDAVIIANEPTMKMKCHQMFGSSLTPETGNNALNPLMALGGSGDVKVYALNFGDRTPTGAVNSTAATSNQYRWVVVDTDMISRSWQLMMAEEPTPEQKFTDSDNVLAKILVTQFAAYACVQPQGSLFSLSITKPTLS